MRGGRPRCGQAPRGLWCLRRVRARDARRPPRLPGHLRAAAPWSGVRRDRDVRRPPPDRRQGHGPGVQRVRRPHPRRARRRPGHRAHPLLDHRVEHVEELPAALPRRRAHPVLPGAQRQPGQHRGARRRGGHAARHGRQRHRRHGRADRAGVRPRRPRRGRHTREGAARGAAEVRGSVLADAARPPPHHRRARPARLPTAVPRQARHRLGAGVRDPGARRRRCPLRPRARPGRDGRHRRRRRAVAAPLRP